MSKQSHHEALESIPALFNALLEDPDENDWTVFTFPVDYDTSLFGANTKDSQFYTRRFHESMLNVIKISNVSADSSDHNLQSVEDLKTVTVNCSVAFMSPCMSMIKW